jgi:AraC-like DNA-binding protein
MTHKRKNATLSPLVFGEAQALEFATPQATEDYFGPIIPSLRAVHGNDEGNFVCRTSSLRVNRQMFVASSTTRYTMDLGEAPMCRFVMNQSGSVEVLRRGRPFHIGPQTSVFFSCDEQHVITRSGSVIVADIDRCRIESVAKSMLGDAGTEAVLDLSETRFIDNRIGGVSFLEAMSAIVASLNSYGSQSRVLSLLNLDESFYRLLATFIRPDLFLAEDFSHHQIDPSAIDSICDAVTSRTDKPLSLTEMESLSGLSARSIQYAFKKRFGCSPMEWQRAQRLDIAYRLLLNDPSAVSIREVAFQTGFASPSRFAEKFRERFGETPRQAIKSRRRAPNIRKDKSD